MHKAEHFRAKEETLYADKHFCMEDVLVNGDMYGLREKPSGRLWLLETICNKMVGTHQQMDFETLEQSKCCGPGRQGKWVFPHRDWDSLLLNMQEAWEGFREALRHVKSC